MFAHEHSRRNMPRTVLHSSVHGFAFNLFLSGVIRLGSLLQTLSFLHFLFLIPESLY
jgi:hypothetical protein